MCEIRVVMEQNGKEETLMQNVTKIDVIDNGVSITSLFEGSRDVPDTVVKNIDFLAGTVYLQKAI